MSIRQASSRTEAAPPAAAAQFLTFVLGDELYAMDIRTVREIIQPVAMSPVPLMAVFVRGVINLRGAVVPVIDLQARLGKAPATLGKKTCIVIFQTAFEAGTIELGLQVDSVNEVIDIPAHDIEPPPPFGSSIEREFIRGMGKVAGRFLIILEHDKALDIDAMASLAPAASPALRH